jgi:hypothetical protein
MRGLKRKKRGRILEPSSPIEFLSPDGVFDGVMRVVETAAANLHFSLCHSFFHQPDSPIWWSFFNGQCGCD